MLNYQSIYHVFTVSITIYCLAKKNDHTNSSCVTVENLASQIYHHTVCTTMFCWQVLHAKVRWVTDTITYHHYINCSLIQSSLLMVKLPDLLIQPCVLPPDGLIMPSGFNLSMFALNPRTNTVHLEKIEGPVLRTIYHDLFLGC